MQSWNTTALRKGRRQPASCPSISEQPIGWEPDINDGVPRTFPAAKQALGFSGRNRTLNWNKDRGKEPMRSRKQFPWFWDADKFNGERVNDVHLTNAEKHAARERAERKS